MRRSEREPASGKMAIEQREKQRLAGVIERRERLVEHPHLGGVERESREPDSAALSRGQAPRRQPAALLETDLCKRLGDSGRHTLYVPAAAAVHHEQLSSDRSSGRRRIVEFHRNRDLYMRKHHGAAAAFAVRALTAFSYLPRAAAAVVLPGHDARHYLLHASQALHPHGEGLREAAAARAGE